MTDQHELPPEPGSRAPLAPFNGFSWAAVQIGFAALMTVGYWGSYERPWVVVLAVVLSGAVAGMPLSTRWARTVLGRVTAWGWVPLAALVGGQVRTPVTEFSVLWPAASASLATGLLAMVGMWRLAWLITGALVVLVAWWTVLHGLPVAMVVEQTTVLAGPVSGTVYRFFMRTARHREAAALRDEALALEQIGRLASQAEARREYRTRILRQVGPILERIESGQELTGEDREECRLIEASLRDAIRGRGLATRDILEAARAARERGALVTLIDDRRVECVDEVCRNVLAATRETLHSADSGDTCVARLLPVGRRNVATVLLVNPEGDGVRREFTMPPSGDPADGAVERPPVSLTG